MNLGCSAIYCILSSHMFLLKLPAVLTLRQHNLSISVFCSFLAMELILASRNYVSELSLRMCCKGNPGNPSMLEWFSLHCDSPSLALLFPWSCLCQAWRHWQALPQFLKCIWNFISTEPLLWLLEQVLSFLHDTLFKNQFLLYCYTDLQTNSTYYCYYYYQNSRTKFL